MTKIKVENTEISIVNVQNEDYISLLIWHIAKCRSILLSDG